MSSSNSRLRKPVLMHRNRSKWDRLLTSGDVRGQKFVERQKDGRLMVCEGYPVDGNDIFTQAWKQQTKAMETIETITENHERAKEELRKIQ